MESATLSLLNLRGTTCAISLLATALLAACASSPSDPAPAPVGESAAVGPASGERAPHRAVYPDDVRIGFRPAESSDMATLEFQFEFETVSFQTADSGVSLAEMAFTRRVETQWESMRAQVKALLASKTTEELKDRALREERDCQIMEVVESSLFPQGRARVTGISVSKFAFGGSTGSELLDR